MDLRMEENALCLINKIIETYDKIGILWDTGKESTLRLYLARKAGLTDIPVIFIDTYSHFPETIEFRDRITEEWNLNLHVVRAQRQKAIYDKKKCHYYHSLEPFLKSIEDLMLDVVIMEETGGFRVDPIRTWLQEDIDKYSKVNNIPINPLYEKGYDKVRCELCKGPDVEPEYTKKDEEEILEYLRRLGYL